MALRKQVPKGSPISISGKPFTFSKKLPGNAQLPDPGAAHNMEPDVDVDLREVYFLMIHLLSGGPCQKTYAQLWNELLEHQLLPRRYHAWYSRNGLCSGDENDDGMSFPLTYTELVERYPHIQKDHLFKLLKQLVSVLSKGSPSRGIGSGKTLNAADVPTLLGTGSFSLLSCDKGEENNDLKRPPVRMRWPHMHADQVRGLSLREIGGGFTRHHRAPSIRAACYAIAKPSTMVQKMQNIKRIRGHRNAVYCATFDRSGRYVITGSDDRLVKIWSMETAYCLASCRGHEGDITDLAVSSNNAFIASSSNDCVIRVWRLPDGLPVSVLRGHTGAVTAIAFSPRPGCPYQLLSSSDDGTCRIWDARGSQFGSRIYVPRPPDSGKNGGPSSSNAHQIHQIFCCAFNANGTVFVTGSSDTLARVWNACKTITDESDQQNHEIDILSGHENDVNYVQFSGCAVGSRFAVADNSKEENVPKFKNSWYCHDNIVTCSRDGSAIIWIPRSRRSHGKNCRWTRAYHLKVPPPPMPPQPPRGGPRQRILPTPRGVNMIAWSLDNRFVLAAIMDNRICVWNASDGSLVHSLTGHSASTYVLDVHPFNPRIAMSAGYDGKTIVWDIWEGIPIQIYEISRYKLVDGKFSPDGTSVILSDDVGQSYILSTGQGESQKDAKYDQFFLGDYRPLIQDTHGNVLDQETQLPPYRRNMEDPLCDSGMIPYPEPYQTMFQQRRLGALGKEWRPSSLKLAVGPDITLDQDYQMPPLADLDLVIEPLPEFVDVMDWEPEIDILSDDNDSEYNVPEEYSTGRERESLSSSTSGESECSAEESDDEGNHQNGLRRSKRKKPKSEAEIMTSSGRRVKRRNFDEFDGVLSNNNRSKKSRHGHKERKGRSSKSKSSRPRRAAARNALTWFSKITGTSKDAEDEDASESGDSSESESMTQDSDFGDGELDGALSNEQRRNLKGKEVPLCGPEDEDEHREFSEYRIAGNRTSLVLRFPVRNSNNLVTQENIVGSSSNGHRAALGNGNLEGGTQQQERFESHTDRSEGYCTGKINWGTVKARTSKRMRLGEGTSSHGLAGLNQVEKETIPNEHVNYQDGGSVISQSSEFQVNESNHMDDVTVGACLSSLNEMPNREEQCSRLDESPKGSSIPPTEDGSNHLPDLKDSLPPISMKLRLRSKRISRDPETPLKQEMKFLAENHENGSSEALISGSLDTECHPSLLNLLKDDGIHLTHGDASLRESDAQVNDALTSTSHDSPRIPSHPKKMFDYVYRRSKLRKSKNISEGSVASVTQESIPDSCSQGHSASVHMIQSNGVEDLTGDPTLRPDKMQDSHDAYNDTQNGSARRCQNSQEELGSTSRATVGLRSSRNRRSTYRFSDISPVEKKKSMQLPGKGLWLMLSTHEGSRYIPQKGDEVVYLRQGHQEYLSYSTLKEVGPWSSIRGGNIRAVEFCKVESLEYATLPGSGDSCCKMILKFVDPSSNVCNKSFKLTLPEVVGFPDFLVERSRYEAATQRNWTCRDKCRVWWKNEGEEDGSWWEGRIVAVKPKSPDFPDSPWERYTVKYKSDPTETHLHSPWELFDCDIQWEQPRIDDESTQKLLSAFAKLEKSGKRSQDPYVVQKLKQVMHKSSYTNRFPVPLSLEVIQARLENNYYRSLEAVKHDISVMLSNAESYFGKNAEVSAKIRLLSDWFNRTLSTL